MTSPLAQWTYENVAYDLVRFRDSDLDATLADFVADALAGDDLPELRRALDDDDVALLLHYAQRRIVAARRTSAATALADAFDAFAVVPTLSDAHVAVWVKAGLLFAVDLEMDIEALYERFANWAPSSSTEKLRIAIDALERLEHLAQCQLVETNTSYGRGLLHTIVMREAASDSPLMATFGVPVKLGAFEAGFDLASRVAGIAAILADSFDALDGHQTNELHHDQLVAACFDVVTSGSFLPAQACVSFHVTAPDGLSFSVVVADVDAAQTGYSAEELAEMADDLADQAAVSNGNYLILLTVVPDFADMFAVEDEADEADLDEEFDDDPLSVYLDQVTSVLDEAVTA